jgi:hypothetical protein
MVNVNTDLEYLIFWDTKMCYAKLPDFNNSSSVPKFKKNTTNVPDSSSSDKKYRKSHHKYLPLLNVFAV